MKKPVIRVFAISTLSLVFLAGCSSRKLQTKIKEMEKEMEERQASYDELIAQRDRTITEKSAASDEAEGKARDKISELSNERDRLNAEVRDLQLKLSRLQAEADARKSVDGSTTGEGPDLAKDPKFSEAMVSIVGDVSKSTGVVIEDGGKRYIYTTGEALAGNTRLAVTNAAGTKFTKFGSLQTAVGCAVARIELLEEGVPAIPLASSDQPAATQGSFQILSLVPGPGGAVEGTKVTAYSQSDDIVGCDASVLSGKAGGVLVDRVAGKAVAVVVNQSVEPYSLWERSVDPSRVQTVAQRINRSISWQPVPIKSFLEESKRIADFNRMSRVIHAFGAMVPSGEGLGISGFVGDGGTVKSVLAASADVPVAAEAVALDAQLAQKKVRFGEADLKKRLKGLFSGVVSQSKAGVAGFSPESFSSYNRKAAEQSLKWRTEADQALQRTADGIDNLTIAKPVDRYPPQNPRRR